MNATLPSILAHALVQVAPPDSVVHQIVKAEPLPVSDPVPLEYRRAVDRILNLDRDALRMRNPFPGERL